MMAHREPLPRPPPCPLSPPQANAGFLVDIASVSPEAKDSGSVSGDRAALRAASGEGAADPAATAAAAAEVAKLK